MESITGLDVKSGIRRVAGKRDFYEKLIRQFCDGEESRTVETVRSLLADNQPEDAERAAHSLKGVAGTLGAQEIQSRAEGLKPQSVSSIRKPKSSHTSHRFNRNSTD